MYFLRTRFTCKPTVIKNKGQPDWGGGTVLPPAQLALSTNLGRVWTMLYSCCPAHTSHHPRGPLAVPYHAVPCRLSGGSLLTRLPVLPHPRVGEPHTVPRALHMSTVWREAVGLGWDPLSAQLSVLVNTPNSPA